MAGSFSGKRFPLLILLVSLFSSVHAIRENFNKFARGNAATIENSYQTKQQPQSFYQQDESGVGLYASPPPPTHTPPPPYKKHYKTNAPPPPPAWLPKNFNPFQYTTNVNDQNFAYKPEIIEEDDKYKKDTTEFDPTDFLEEEEVPSPREMYKPSSFYQHKNSYQPKQQGMSDTNFLENGKYHFGLYDNKFTSKEHPFNTINNQDKTNYPKYNKPLTTTQSYNLDFENEDDEQP